MTSRAWPNLFIVGAARAGTTSLWRYLDQHPEIWMSPLKEPHYFSGVRPRLYQSISDEQSYLRLFVPGSTAAFRGEASPSYLWHEAVPAAIKRINNAAQIVISLRDPVERAHSAYWHAVRHGAERRPFLQVVLAELAEPSPGGIPSRFVTRSLYADSVARYLGAFPESTYVMFFEEFAADVRGELRRLFIWLGVDPGVVNAIDPAVHNPFSQPRGAAGRTVHNSPRIRAVGRRIVPRTLYPAVERLLLERSRKPLIDDDVARLLTKHFAADVERLRLMLGRDLPWDRFDSPELGERQAS